MPELVSDRTLRRLAGAVLGICVVLAIGTIALVVGTYVSTGRDPTGGDNAVEGLFFLLDAPVFAAVGALIVHTQARNPIGWLLVSVGLAWALGLSLSTYADYGTRYNPDSVPAPALVNALGVWTWIPAVGLMAIFVPLLFPDGHLPSSRWRWLAWTAGAVMVVLSLGMMVDPHAFDDSTMEGVANPLAVQQLPQWLRLAVLRVVFPLFPLCMVAAAVAAVRRYRRSDGIERLQMKWLVTAGAFFAAFFGLMLLSSLLVPAMRNNGIVNTLLPLTFTLFPLAIGAAILKHGLYEIDVVISRSLVFGALATFITAVYVAVVVGVGHLIGSGDRPNLALSVAATAIIAVAFEPVRNRLQRLANRLVYGERATPYEILSSFADRVGGAYDATELLPLMARTVGQGVDAAGAEVWLRRADGFELAATWDATGGSDPVDARARPPSLEITGADRVVEVRDHDELLGAVAVTKPQGKELSAVEERLLNTLAAQSGPVLRNMRLIEDLRTSRQRLVAMQDEERRRLERNLHDGAQQSLVAVALMIRLAQPTIAARSAVAGECLEQAAAELGTAIEELRDLARGIYPVVLADRGLGAALDSLAQRSPVPVVVDVRLVERAPADIERALYFIAAEALSTSLAAGAGEARVDLRRAGDALVLRIDDGGLAPESPERGLPLQGLLDRAAVVDAALEIAPSQGTSPLPGLHLTCTVSAPEPLRPPVPESADVTAVPLGAGQ